MTELQVNQPKKAYLAHKLDDLLVVFGVLVVVI